MYALLGVAEEATADEIKRAYRTKALANHPDRQGGDKDKFQQQNQAYDILSNPVKRAAYDALGMDGVTRVISNDESTNRAQKLILTLTLEELFQGAQKREGVKRAVLCATCYGIGGDKKSQQKNCDACGGRGSKATQTHFGMQIMANCSRCAGSGQVAIVPCAPCNGRGFNEEKVHVDIDIPASSTHERPIVIKNKGHHLPFHSQPHDLIVVLNPLKHETFTLIQNNHLMLERPIRVADMLCGFQDTIEHLDKRVLQVNVAPFSNIVKISGEGLGDKTNLYVKYILQPIKTPLTQEQRQQLRALMEQPESKVDGGEQVDAETITMVNMRDEVHQAVEREDEEGGHGGLDVVNELFNGGAGGGRCNSQ